MVTDPLLAEHLAHWGINVMAMQKTEKSMAELQIDLNKGFEFDKITEAGAELEPVCGAKRVGLKNMGNTCYVDVRRDRCLKEAPRRSWTRYRRAQRWTSSRGARPRTPTGDFPDADAPRPCAGLDTDQLRARGDA